LTLGLRRAVVARLLRTAETANEWMWDGLLRHRRFGIPRLNLLAMFIFCPYKLSKAISDGVLILANLRTGRAIRTTDLKRESRHRHSLEVLNKPKSLIRKNLLQLIYDRCVRSGSDSTSLYSDLSSKTGPGVFSATSSKSRAIRVLIRQKAVSDKSLSTQQLLDEKYIFCTHTGFCRIPTSACDLLEVSANAGHVLRTS